MSKFGDRQKLNKCFATFIKSIRIEKNLTQAQLSEKLRIDSNHLSKIETFNKNVTFDMFLEICEIFEIDPVSSFSIIYSQYQDMLNLTTSSEETIYIEKIKNLPLNKKALIIDLIKKISEL